MKIKLVLVLALLIIAILAIFNALQNNKNSDGTVDSYEECVAAGGFILESDPPQCELTYEGKRWTQ